MATVFKRKNSDTWTAAFRAWHAGKGRWVWKQASTGATDEGAAAGIAAKLEQASAAAWLCLCSLGWHTGHRLHDLLDLTGESIDGDLVTMQPRKKAQRGGRTVVLPLPRWLAAMVKRMKNFKALNRADNRNGRVSQYFGEWIVKAGIDQREVDRGSRVVHLKTFHSYRHSMSSRLTAAGVSGELARLVTDHDSPQVARKYVHAEIQGLRDALKKARNRK